MLSRRNTNPATQDRVSNTTRPCPGVNWAEGFIRFTRRALMARHAVIANINAASKNFVKSCGSFWGVLAPRRHLLMPQDPSYACVASVLRA
jgi:hypothetical protein